MRYIKGYGIVTRRRLNRIFQEACDRYIAGLREVSKVGGNPPLDLRDLGDNVRRLTPYFHPLEVITGINTDTTSSGRERR